MFHWIEVLISTVARITLVASRAMCQSRRDERVALVHVAPCLFQHGGRRRSSSARVKKFSLLCSGYPSVSGKTSGNREVDMSIRVHAVATPGTRVVRVALVVTNVSHRAARLARHSTSRLFPVAKMHGL